MASARVTQNSSSAKAVFLILLLLSAGLSAPTASALQRSQLGGDFSQLNLPVPQTTSNPNAGAFFFSYFGASTNGGVYSPTSSEGETPNSLPQIPVLGSSGDYFYIRQGNDYNFFPENVLENGGSPYALVAFGPLLSVWLDSERRRSRFRIYVEILDLLRKGPMTPYEVSFHLRLNSKRTNEYIEFLAEKKFLDCIDQEGKLVCTITTPGATFVENLKTILDQSE
jgi:predicted transcriptional regulator